MLRAAIAWAAFDTGIAPPDWAGYFRNAVASSEKRPYRVLGMPSLAAAE
jgi:hypothetical protein